MNDLFHMILRTLLISIALFTVSALASAPPPEPSTDFIYDGQYRSLLDRSLVESQISPHSLSLFGESLDLSSGALSFGRVDGSIPGNSSLEVAYRTVYNTNFTSFGRLG